MKSMADISENFRPITIDFNDSEKFTQIELLHTTHYAKLYRARKAGKFFILKAPKEGNAIFFDLLKREYELTIGLTHPYIVHVFTYEPNTPIGPAIVMEYVDGQNLSDYLNTHPSLNSRIRIFEQILSAVNCLHKADIIHNDLKPENILITRADNDIRLIDFGLSDCSTFFNNRTLGGTWRYASPELRAQSPDTDARSDIYSIGKIMQDLFGNRFRHIRNRCLQEKKEKRYDNVEQLQRAWNKRHLPLKITTWGIFTISLSIIIIVFTKEYHRNRRQEIQDLRISLHKDSIQSTIQNEKIKLQQTKATTLQNEVASYQRKYENDVLKRERYKKAIDSLQKYNETQLQAAFTRSKDSLEKVPFREFAFNIATNFSSYCWSIRTTSTNIPHYSEMTPSLTTHFDQIALPLQESLYDLTASKPYLDEVELSGQEIQFYRRLLESQRPFTFFIPR